jgi:hypothetical protein
MKKPLMNQSHKQERLAFAREHQNWGIRDWSLVIGSNVASLQTTIEKHNLNCLAPTFKFGKMSIMVWGAFTATSKCYLFLIPSRQHNIVDFVDVV